MLDGLTTSASDTIFMTMPRNRRIVVVVTVRSVANGMKGSSYVDGYQRRRTSGVALWMTGWDAAVVPAMGLRPWPGKPRVCEASDNAASSLKYPAGLRTAS